MSDREQKASCIVCRNDIRPSARKCSECDSYQDWRRHVFAWTGLVSAIVAVAPAWGIAISLWGIAGDVKLKLALSERTVDQFSKAMANLLDASNAYFDQVNYINFHTALASAEYSKTPVSKETLQDPFFSNEDMAVRRAELATMRDYAACLVKIANDNLGEGFRTEVAHLKGNVLALESALKVASSETKLKTLQNNTGFVSDVFGTIGKMIIGQKQADALALADAILQADPAMRAAVDLLAQDIQLITSKIRSERARQFAIAVDSINSELQHASLEQRLKLVEGVRPYSDQVIASRAIGSNFDAAYDAYRSAQSDMTVFAKAKRKNPQMLADLAATVDVLAERREGAGNVSAAFKTASIEVGIGRPSGLGSSPPPGWPLPRS